MRKDPIKSYEDAAALFHTCRNHYKGKPLPANWRLHKDDSGLRPVYWIDTSRFGASQRLCSIHPDNTVQFHYSVDRLVRASNTIVMVLHKIFPMACTRKRQGIYEMGPVCGEQNPPYPRTTYGLYSWPTLDKDFACEYFQGLTFDLKSNRITNPQPDLVDRAISDVRKAWRKDLTRFKRGLKARAKVGALTGYIDEIRSADRTWSFWNSELRADDGSKILTNIELTDSQEYVLECMRNDSYPPDLLRAFVRWAGKHNIYSRHKLDDKLVLKYVDQMFNKYSLDFRKAYGVFGDKNGVFKEVV